MKTIDDIAIELGKVNSLMYAAEGAMLEEAENPSRKNIFADLFYVIMERLEKLADDVKEIEGHRLVVSAVQAVNEVSSLRAENKALKEYIEQLSA